MYWAMAQLHLGQVAQYFRISTHAVVLLYDISWWIGRKLKDSAVRPVLNRRHLSTQATCVFDKDQGANGVVILCKRRLLKLLDARSALIRKAC